MFCLSKSLASTYFAKVAYLAGGRGVGPLPTEPKSVVQTDILTPNIKLAVHLTPFTTAAFSVPNKLNAVLDFSRRVCLPIPQRQPPQGHIS